MSETTDGTGEYVADESDVDPVEGGMQVTFLSLPGTAALSVVDPIERHRYTLSTPTPVAPESVDPHRFLFPVESAVSITADSLTLPSVEVVFVRDASGGMLAKAEQLADETFPPGEYVLEICGPIKIYLEFEAPMTVESDLERTEIDFGGETDILVGGRSSHERPAGTITTPPEPAAMMEAVSAFGSALKTTSPERSFPTLRGHPPRIELGEELSIPRGLEQPETGVTLELRPTYRDVYVGASLAYYLGAAIVPGSIPRLVTDAGFETRLDTGAGFETEVARTLEQVFFLDCVTRTEGYYQVDLHDRNALESALEFDLDFADLYDRPLAERLEAYLEIPYGTVEPLLPQWKLTAHVEATPDTAEMLPFLVDDLAIVRTGDVETLSEAEASAVSIGTGTTEAFTRSTATDGGAIRGMSRGTAADADPYVRPDPTESLTEVWVGDGIPVGASKAMPAAFEHRLERTPTTGDIEIAVVCNDAKMSKEREVVDDIYGTRDSLPFETDVHERLSTDELRDVLATETDFLHYIGHVDDEGFVCSDGKLDAATLGTVGVDTFLLNACQSYTQGANLIEAGSIGGIVTISDVINSGAVEIGRLVARLLNRGFPLQAALEVACSEHIVGGLYIVVGDGGMSVTQSESIPNICRVSTPEEPAGKYELEQRTYLTARRGLGSMYVPYIGNNSTYFLMSGTSNKFTISADTLEEFLSCETIPVYVDGTLQWSDEIDIDYS